MSDVFGRRDNRASETRSATPPIPINLSDEERTKARKEAFLSPVRLYRILVQREIRYKDFGLVQGPCSWSAKKGRGRERGGGKTKSRRQQFAGRCSAFRIRLPCSITCDRRCYRAETRQRGTSSCLSRSPPSQAAI